MNFNNSDFLDMYSQLSETYNLKEDMYDIATAITDACKSKPLTISELKAKKIKGINDIFEDTDVYIVSDNTSDLYNIMIEACAYSDTEVLSQADFDAFVASHYKVTKAVVIRGGVKLVMNVTADEATEDFSK